MISSCLSFLIDRKIFSLKPLLWLGILCCTSIHSHNVQAGEYSKEPTSSECKQFEDNFAKLGNKKQKELLKNWTPSDATQAIDSLLRCFDKVNDNNNKMDKKQVEVPEITIVKVQQAILEKLVFLASKAAFTGKRKLDLKLREQISNQKLPSKIRSKAIWALSQISDHQTIPLLIQALCEKDARISAAAAKALQKMPPTYALLKALLTIKIPLISSIINTSSNAKQQSIPLKKSNKSPNYNTVFKIQKILTTFFQNLGTAKSIALLTTFINQGAQDPCYEKAIAWLCTLESRAIIQPLQKVPQSLLNEQPLFNPVKDALTKQRKKQNYLATSFAQRYYYVRIVTIIFTAIAFYLSTKTQLQPYSTAPPAR